MKKYILMMLFSSFVGIFANPEILSASNSVKTLDLDSSKIVQTVIPEVPKVAEEVYVASEPVYEPVYEPRIFSVGVTVDKNDIEVNPSYSDIYQTGKLIYAHNTSNLLRGLYDLYSNDTFIINGVTYRVSDRVVYDKTDAYSLNGSRAVMKNLKNSAYGHDFALMTCYGTSLGNGDATQRLVIFADKA